MGHIGPKSHKKSRFDKIMTLDYIFIKITERNVSETYWGALITFHFMRASFKYVKKKTIMTKPRDFDSSAKIHFKLSTA